MSESITEERLATLDLVTVHAPWTSTRTADGFEVRDTDGDLLAECWHADVGDALTILPDLLAEVRRLRAEIQEMAVLVGRLRGESDTLRADLAEEKQEHQATLAMNAALRERVRVLEGALKAESIREILGAIEDGGDTALGRLWPFAQAWMADRDAALGGGQDEEDEPEPENQPIGHCPKCGVAWYADEGFCGGCAR